MKRIILLAFLIPACFAGSVFAQPVFKSYPDSIRVELPDLGAIVVFEMRNYPQANEVIRGFPQALAETLDMVKKSSTSSLTPQHIEIQIMPEGMKEIGISMKPYGEKRLVTIQPIAQPQTKMTMLKDRGIVELLPPGWELYLLAKEYRVKVYAADFASMEAITTQNFTLVVDAINSDKGMPTLWRKSIDAQAVIRGNKLERSAVQYIFPGDNISLNLNAGVGLYQNIIYPELSLKLGLSFKDRFRRPNYRIALTYNNLFFAERTSGEFATYINSFLSFSYEKNFNRKTAQAQWSGIGIGFLTRRSNDYFKGNTAKLFITHSIPNSRFSMVPEFYLTDDFKKFTFGMTLKYSF